MFRKILMIVLILLITDAHALQTNNKAKSPFRDECGKQFIVTRNRIFGGHHAQIGEYPWLVLLLHARGNNATTPGCTGFIIHRKFILTAAHCASKSLQDRFGPIEQVLLGEHDTFTEKDCKLFNNITVCADPPVKADVKQKKIIVHNRYDDSHSNRDHHFDIALIQLKNPMKYTKYIQPICLAEEPTEAKSFVISGWGKPNVTERSSNVKLKVSIDSADHQYCVKKYRGIDTIIAKSQICAGGEFGIDSCSGDSGGPLMMQKNSTWYAEGIVSFGKECGAKGWPGVYTNIPHYIDWIKTRITQRLETDRKTAERKKKKNL